MCVRLRDDPERLLIQNLSYFRSVLGALVAGAGGLCALVASGLMGEKMAFPPPFRLELGLLGGVAVAGGAWLCWRSPRATLVVDRATQRLTLTRHGLFRRNVEQYPGAAIADVRVTKERDGKGDPVYHIELVLQTGDVVPVSLLHPRDRAGCMRAAEHLWTALGMPRT
jgi:hypothetical protein